MAAGARLVAAGAGLVVSAHGTDRAGWDGRGRRGRPALLTEQVAVAADQAEPQEKPEP